MLVAHRPREVTMHALPTAMIQLLAPFAPLFSKRVWSHVQVLLMGTILAPGKRTVSATLRAAGLGGARGASSATIGCLTVPHGPAGKRAGCSWGCW
jgi:hypothetical protein